MAAKKRPLTVMPNQSGEYVRGKTRGGNDVRLYADDGGGDYPVHGAWYYQAEDRWIPAAWTIDGFVTTKETPRSLDLDLKKVKF
jgi:hypothetical protein